MMNNEPEHNDPNIKSEELTDITDQKTAPLLDPVRNKSITDEQITDLSDPNAFELMLDDSPADDTRLQNAQKRLISLDISNQKGVALQGNYIILPGRVSLLLITLSLILFTVIGLSFGFLHFSIIAPNYLLAFAVLQIILFIQIVLYHSSYRAQRTAIGVIVTLVTILVIFMVDFFFSDLVAHPKRENSPSALLLITTISFSAVPLIMFTHLVFLGRGTRTVAIKRKKSDNIPTEIMAVKDEKNTPTEIMDEAKNEKDIPTEIMDVVKDERDIPTEIMDVVKDERDIPTEIMDAVDVVKIQK